MRLLRRDVVGNGARGMLRPSRFQYHQAPYGGGLLSGNGESKLDGLMLGSATWPGLEMTLPEAPEIEAHLKFTGSAHVLGPPGGAEQTPRAAAPPAGACSLHHTFQLPTN